MSDCHDSVAMQAFRKGLVQGTPFNDSLTMRTPKNMVDVFNHAFEFLKLEDDRRLSREERPIKKSN